MSVSLMSVSYECDLNLSGPFQIARFLRIYFWLLDVLMPVLSSRAFAR